jgi:hypothetical protein
MQQTNIVDIKLEEPRQLSQGVFFGAFDVSDSMTWSGTSVGFNRVAGHITRGEILTMFIAKLKSLYKFKDSLMWSTDVKTLPADSHYLRFGGGTDPNVIIGRMADADVLVFSTDGEISPGTLNTFQARLDKTYPLTVVCVVGWDVLSPSQINMSVVAPFMTRPHIGLLLTETQTKVISFNGVDLPLRPVDFSRGISGLQDFSLTSLANIKVGRMTPCPVGFTQIGDKYVRLDGLDRLTYDEFRGLDFPSLLIYFKNRGQLPQLRNAVKRHVSSVAVSSQEDTLIAQIVAASDDAERLAALKQQLRDRRVAESMAAQRVAIDQQRRALDEARDRAAQINTWLGQITEAEKASYNAVDLANISSNRLLRAKVAEQPTSAIDFAGAPEFECELCMENRPGCLLIKDVAKDSKHPRNLDPAGDFMLTFPLAYEGDIFCPNVYCVECGEKLLALRQDMYRQPVCGVYHLVDLARNFRQVSYNVYHGLTHDREAHHIFKLIYASIIYSKMSEWAARPEVKRAFDYIETQLLTHTRDRDGMAEGGQIMSLRDVIARMATTPNHLVNFLRQPFTAHLVILMTMLGIKEVPREAVHILATQALCRAVTSAFNGYLNNNHGLYLRRDIRRDIFDHPHGQPILESAHLTDFTRSAALKAMFGYHNGSTSVYRHVEYLMRQCKVEFAPETVTALLAAVYSLKQHAKLEDVVNELLASHPVYNKVYRGEVITEVEALEAARNIIGRFKEFDAKHVDALPPFISAAGPSVLVCSCGHRFDHDTSDDAGITQNRMRHFEDVYGSFYPNASSAHCNLHEAVKHVLRTVDVNVTTLTREHVIRIMANLRDRKGQGNIYDRKLCRDVVWVARSFFTARARFPMMAQRVATGDRVSRVDRIALERSLAQPSHYVMDTTMDETLMAPFTEDELKTFDSI